MLTYPKSVLRHVTVPFKILLYITAFCETCVAINPSDLKNIKNKIVFSTGCKTARCIADLKLSASLEDVLRFTKCFCKTIF